MLLSLLILKFKSCRIPPDPVTVQAYWRDGNSANIDSTTGCFQDPGSHPGQLFMYGKKLDLPDCPVSHKLLSPFSVTSKVAIKTNEDRYSSRIRGNQGNLQLRKYLQDTLNSQWRPAHRGVFGMSSVLYRSTKNSGYCRSC